MSLVFSDTTNKRGIIQVYEKKCGFNYGDVSGDDDKLKEATADINLAVDEFFEIGFNASGGWQLGDSNFDNYSIIFRNLVSGQRDYPITEDEDGNLILDVFRVFVANSSGIYTEMDAVDQQTRNSSTTSFLDGQNATGTPTRYDKTDNSLFLDPVPNYSYTNGIEMIVNREASYFISTDTTKKPGVPGTLHKWFAIRPAKDFIQANGTNDAYTKISNEVEEMKRMIENAFRRRQRDVKPRLIANNESNK